MTEKRVLSGIKASMPGTLRSRVYAKKVALELASWINSKLSVNAGADKVILYETQDYASAVFFRKDCRITEVRISLHDYRFFLFVRGEFPGLQVI